jgi:hypothetical protein
MTYRELKELFEQYDAVESETGYIRIIAMTLVEILGELEGMQQ